MTRINVVPVQELSREHLVAEYREIARVPNNLKKSLTRKGKPFCLSEIPPDYVLGTGHVKFFFNKMLFLQKRFEELVKEMIRRNYTPTYVDSSIFIPEDKTYYNDYIPTKEALEKNINRIKERTKDETRKDY